MTPRAAAPLALLLLLQSSLAEATDKSKERKGRKPAKARAAAIAGCKELAPVDADLRAGLDLYAEGRWAEAATSLAAWAGRPGADSDPAAARGMYALGYAHRAAGHDAAGVAALARAEPLLRARTESAPTLEAWYYLQGLYQMRNESEPQMAAIASALASLEAGEICASRDGDDWFRVARLHAFAGNHEQRFEALRAASSAYASLPDDAPVSPYRSMVEKELGDAAVTSNDLATAEKHLAEAARLDPAIPGIHRQLGLIYLRRGNVEAAANQWRRNWRREQGGNAFLYAVPVMNKVVAYRKQGLEPLTGLSQYATAALEENARREAHAIYALQQEQAEAVAAGTSWPDEKHDEMQAAEHRALQYLLEYVARGEDLQALALKEGLLPLIHGKGLPSRND